MRYAIVDGDRQGVTGLRLQSNAIRTIPVKRVTDTSVQALGTDIFAWVCT